MRFGEKGRVNKGRSRIRRQDRGEGGGGRVPECIMDKSRSRERGSCTQWSSQKRGGKRLKQLWGGFHQSRKYIGPQESRPRGKRNYREGKWGMANEYSLCELPESIYKRLG